MTARRAVAVVVVIALAAALAVLANGRRTHVIGRGGSSALGAGQPVGVTAGPASYRLVYRSEARIGRDVRLATVKVWERRPFDSRTETWTGAPPGRARQSIHIAVLGRSSTTRPDAAPLVSDQPPVASPDDTRLDAILDAARRGRIVQVRERRRVAGRVCQVYRTADLLDTGELRAGSAGTHADTCVDRDGIVLEELQVIANTTTFRRVATSVHVNAPMPDALFAVGAPTVAVPDGGGSTKQVAPTSSPPGRFWELAPADDGFTLVGRYAVVPPQPQNFTNPDREGAKLAGISDVYRNGHDAFVIDQGGTLHGEDPWTADPGAATVDLGPLGPGEVALSGSGAEVRVLTGAGHYVRVSGTVPPDALAAIARRLHAVDGTHLEYVTGS